MEKSESQVKTNLALLRTALANINLKLLDRWKLLDKIQNMGMMQS